MSFSAIQINANALYQPVNQLAHGFSVGQIVRFVDPDFVLADASSQANALTVGMVSSLFGADSFYITQVGFVAGLTTTPTEGGNFIPNTLYYLSQTPGELTSIPPVTTGQVIEPLYIAYTDTSGFFFGNPGDLIEPDTLFGWNEVAVNTAMTVNTGYLINGAGVLDMTLPAAATVGDTIKIATKGVNGVSILQNAGQSINFVDVNTTVGVAGQIDLLTTNAVLQGSLEIICTTNNTNFKVLNGNGNWDVL